MLVNAEMRNFRNELEKHCFVLKMRKKDDWCLLDSANKMPKFTKPVGNEEVFFDQHSFFAKCTMMIVYILEADEGENFSEVLDTVKRKMLGQ